MMTFLGGTSSFYAKHFVMTASLVSNLFFIFIAMKAHSIQPFHKKIHCPYESEVNDNDVHNL